MQNVLTLIAGLPSALRDSRVIAAAIGVLAEAGCRVGSVAWLGPDRACDIPFEGLDPAAAEKAVRARLAGLAVDLAAQNAAGRRKRILVADMESTIITRELLDELATTLGLSDRIAPITARSMRGEIEFAQSLRERVAFLAGQPESVLAPVAQRIELMAGARLLVRTMRAAGAYTALVSGGFDCYAAIAAEACGFEEFHANRLEISDSRMTGRVAEPILDRNGKRAILQRLAETRGIPLEATAAIGDGANDFAMLQAAGLGVAFRGKPALAAAARFRLDHSDLTGLLYLQGYRSQEFRE
jgi:phosphoserine phosphatase